MAVKIQVRRGSKAGLPKLSPGEFGFATDTKELFIGGQSGNIQVASKEELNAHVNNKSNPHGVTAAQVRAVPTGRKVNGKALSTDITLSAADVGADSTGTAAAQAKAVQDNLNSHTGNKSNPHGVTASQVGAVPTSRTVNGKVLSGNITLNASDVGALPTSGGTLTGNLTGKYITGTWLQVTSDNHLTSAAAKFCVQDADGWVYHRTASEMLSDLGVNSAIQAAIGNAIAASY